MAGTVKTKIRAHGMRVLLARHPEVRRLKRNNTPSSYGNRLWTSSWVLMDYLKRKGLKQGARVMEVGCGWGLAGIYCAKKHGAVVTGADIDPDVFPFLQLHADVNKVNIDTMEKGFDGLRGKHFEDFDVVIGSDICFWEDQIHSLKKLILRALRAGVQRVILSDPGRTTFEELGGYFVDKEVGKLRDWTTHRPRRIQGRILELNIDY